MTLGSFLKFKYKEMVQEVGEFKLLNKLTLVVHRISRLSTSIEVTAIRNK